nr:retrotransposon protein, putative, Ty1-copia subclass [Tanacetum cinerariifolium]
KENPNKDQACHHCHVVRHWKRNCPLYLKELHANKKKSEPSAAVSVNGVFEINMNNNVSKNNNNSIFSINKKRKLDLNSSYLLHYRLAYIGKTRMQKLHIEGLLENIDEESFDKCESCISGKMTKKPFNKNIERATDLLGLIHTDVCGPLRHVSRKESAVRILNMVPTKKVDKTPYEIWHGKASNLSYLKVWGCEAYVKRDSVDKL